VNAGEHVYCLAADSTCDETFYHRYLAGSTIGWFNNWRGTNINLKVYFINNSSRRDYVSREPASILTSFESIFQCRPEATAELSQPSKQTPRRMAISRASLDSIPTSFASVSVETPNDPLPNKLKAISQAGFRAIELGFPDLVSFASTYHKKEIKEDDYDSLCSVGVEVRKLCTACNLGIMKEELSQKFQESLEELSRTIPKDKIYLLQISDG
jgi:hypothetical protein